MGVLTTSVSTLMSQLQCTTHAMLGQQEERQIGDKMHAVDLRIMRLKMLADRAVTIEEKQGIMEKIKNLEIMHEEYEAHYEDLGTGITNVLTGPVQAALPPPQVPPGLLSPSMPPPPPPTLATPACQWNNILPPTPTATASKSGKKLDSSVNQVSPTKTLCMSSTTTQSSPHILNCASRTSSESSVENVFNPKSKRAKKDLAISTGEDSFSDNSMETEHTSTNVVSNVSLSKIAQTNLTCLMHPAPKIIHTTGTGRSDLQPMWLMRTHMLPIIYSDVRLKMDAGCMTGPNKSFSHFQPLAAIFVLPHFILKIMFLVCFLSLLQPVATLPPRASTLSIYALNVNGFISMAKIHHVNNVICSRQPHIFIVSETKTSSKMGSQLPTQEYNVYEETGVHCANHPYI